ncbi:6-carboxytetrahydropterin synthase QueD [Sulfidibacter corallicola]|uniref:6-carboxy-5,6,7,8-tetrahydropterin synthase n=1 Tax=Sulfidibacter corallicola TaxID=2818388 RepID=A0A8A4TJV2_SULCO|nr:6-carboxytetrahydropterin synthase [Sulfidibacter corallicola]QTD50206.1 6-carboxytetrahydropterin synthase [Sulfidibacter corallicola]
MAFEIKVRKTFSASHQLRHASGGCERLHGHNWVCLVYVCGDTLDRNGLLVDFRDIQAALTGVIDELEHTHLNDLAPFRILNPTAENLAKHVFEGVQKGLDENRNNRARVSRVEIFETEDCSAAYFLPQEAASGIAT